MLLTDIVGSSALWERSPERVPALLAEMQLVIDRSVEDLGGRRIGATVEGDATMSSFANAIDAVRAAIALQRELAERSLALRVRTGLSTGELIELDGDVLGPTVNRAARVREFARAGEILLSASTAAVVRAAPPPGVEFRALGPHALRGLDTTDELVAVVADGVTAPPDPQRSPYPGLAPFRSDDADLFFGREEVVARCVELLRADQFVAIVGASGSGKTSVALAGLAPQFTDVVVVRPGEDPERALQNAVVPARAGSVLIVDQLEELVTLCPDPAQRAAFVDRILAHPGPLIVTVRADLYGEFGIYDELARRLGSSQVLLGPLSEHDLLRAVRQPAVACGLLVEDGLAELIAVELGDGPGSLPLLGHALREAWLRRDGRVITVAGYRDSGGVRSAIAATADRALDALDEDAQLVARQILLRMIELRADGEDVRRWATRREVAEVDPEQGPDVVSALADSRLLVVDGDRITVVHEAVLRAWPRLAGWIAAERTDLLARQEVRWAAQRWIAGGRTDGDLYRGLRLGAAVELASRVGLSADEAEFVEAGRRLRDREDTDARRRSRRLRVLAGVSSVFAIVALAVGAIALLQRNEAQRAQTAADAAAVDAAESARQADEAAGAANEERQRAESSEQDALLETLVNRSLALRSTNRSAAALIAVEAFRRQAGPEAWSALLGTITAAGNFTGYDYLPAEFTLNGAIIPGTSTAVVALDGRDLQVFDLETSTLEARFAAADDDAGNYSVLRVSADGRFVAQFVATAAPPQACGDLAVLAETDDRGCGVFSVYEIATGARVLGPVIPPFGLGDVAISPDGAFVAVVGGSDGDLALYRTADGELLGTLAGLPRPDGVTITRDTAAAAFAADDRLYVGSMAGPVRVLAPGTVQVTGTLDAPRMSSHNHVLTTGDGRLVAAGDEAIVVFDTATAARLWTVDLREGIHPEPCPSLAVAPTAERLYCGNHFGVIEERDLATGQRTGVTLDPQLGSVGDLVTTSDGTSLIAFGAGAPVVSQWRLDGYGPATRLVARDHVAFDGYDPSGEMLIVGRRDGSTVTGEQFSDLAVWDPDTDMLIDPLDTFQGGWAGVGRMAGLFADGTQGVYDVTTRTAFSAERDDGLGFGLSAAGARLYVWYPAADDGAEIWAFDARPAGGAAGERIGPAIGVPGNVQGVTATAGGEHVVVNTFDDRGSVTNVYDGETGDLAGGPLIGPHTTSVSPNGVLVAAQAGDITEYDLETLEPIAKFPGARGDVNSLQFSRDGDVLLATSNDQTVSIYDVASHTRLGDPIPINTPLIIPGWLRPDGLAVAMTVREGVAILDLEPARLAEAACRLAGRNLTETEWATYLGEFGEPRRTCPEHD